MIKRGFRWGILFFNDEKDFDGTLVCRENPDHTRNFSFLKSRLWYISIAFSNMAVTSC